MTFEEKVYSYIKMNLIYKIIKSRFPRNPVYATHHYGKLLIAYNESGHAPPHLIAELETQDDGKFWSAVWESLLYNHFNMLGFEFIQNRIKKYGQHGPDFGLLYNGRTVWVEAVVPSPEGIPIETLAPPCKFEKPKAYGEPHEQKLLRWTSAIKDKKDKIRKYIDSEIIDKTDSVVIAVNSCRLQYLAFNDTGISQFPYAVEATFPIGPLAVQFSKKDLKVIGPAENTQRYKLQKVNGNSVPTDNFLNPDYDLISAVMGSPQRDLWGKKTLQLSLVHNPLNKNPLPRQIFGATKEFVCDIGEDSYTLCNILSDVTSTPSDKF